MAVNRDLSCTTVGAMTALAATFKEECKQDKPKKMTGDLPSKSTGKNKETDSSDTTKRSEKRNTPVDLQLCHQAKFAVET